MKIDVFDIMTLAGFVAIIAGVALSVAPSVAAIVAGVMLIIGGLVGAASKQPRKARDQATPQGQDTHGRS